ncbi:hypothetical protein bcere0026_48480 [Bacillus mycoides]|uniref:Uncharacterized protein n=1 Tax=Bacillus mycoides TaxID=1405 RepID=C2Y1K4_BACMY|nr:hypothetical protein bcere0026_48480 [Bacillus mycoides]
MAAKSRAIKGEIGLAEIGGNFSPVFLFVGYMRKVRYRE